MVSGGAIDGDTYLFAQIVAVAHWRGKSAYTYLAELEDVRLRFGPNAADEQLAIDMELKRRLEEEAKNQRGKARTRRSLGA